MKILIGYDGSECANAAVEDLRRAGLPPTGEMVVLSVAEVWPHLPVAAGGIRPELDAWMAPALENARDLSELELKRAHEVAARGADRLRSTFPRWTVKGEAVADAPNWALVKRADAWKPDVIVVGSHGRSALGRFVLGSISHSLLTHARGSVRIGRERPQPHLHSGPTRLIVGFDGSSGADAAISAVAARDWHAGSEARVIAVIDTSISTALPVEGFEAGWLPVRYENPQQWVSHAAKHVSLRLQESGLTAVPQVCVGNPKKVLVEEAQKWDADCIFVGAKGLSRLERFLLGSVSLSVATHAPCSVEVVRP